MDWNTDLPRGWNTDLPQPTIYMEERPLSEIKAEAYKEFAENIKEKCGIFTPLGVNWIEETKAVRVSDIDKILKEMADEIK